MKAFICVCHFETAAIPRGKGSTVPKHKGSIDNATKGVPNLIRVAYDCRYIPPKLLPPPTDNDGNVVLVDEEEECIVGGEVDDEDGQQWS